MADRIDTADAGRTVETVLAGRTAVITGAASGIGRAIAVRLARDGANVVVADNRTEPREGGVPTAELITADGGSAVFIETDVTDEDRVRAVISASVRRFGTLDIICNNAGLSGLYAPITTTSIEDFDRIVAVNLRGVFLGCKHAASEMICRSTGGVIINTASSLGLVGYPGMAAYCATKGAVLQLTRALALELAPHRIRVNALCPGTVATEMDRDQREDPIAGEDTRRRTPFLLEDGGFACAPQDQAAAVAFLASDGARWITGTSLVVDGGWTAA